MSSRVTLSQVVDNITQLSAAVNPAEFIYDFLTCFGLPKATIARLKGADGVNLAKKKGCTLLKTKVYFEPLGLDLLDAVTPMQAIEVAQKDSRIAANKPRFLIATDFRSLAAFDTKRKDIVEFPIGDLHEHYAFFLPLAGMEKSIVHAEAEADVKAAENMAKLYDLIRADNPPKNGAERHALNVFLTRLLFCYFAEDTGIFPDKSFTRAVESYTQPDGSDLHGFLQQLFLTLNTEGNARGKTPPHLTEFQYVNGGLFGDIPTRQSDVPKFSTKSRQKLIELGTKSWKEINPDIFGSMFQSVVDDEKRAELGMHYTSVSNIIKVIRPLFLDDLYAEFENAKGSEGKLKKLLSRIYRLRIFDPACGSGNFLIIAYKELRKLEMVVFQELQRMALQLPLSLSGIQVSQFYGIELDDFAHEIAILALWLAEHQMNIRFEAVFGKAPASLPLKDGAKIICDNATRLDWEEVCPKEVGCEVFVLGNPPYYGARNQSEDQKSDVKTCFAGAPEHKDADFICCWFIKGGQYISKGTAKLAFVTTNSVCQGDHIAILWPRLLDYGLEIGFCYAPFKWSNSAKAKAGVTCVIVGLRRVSLQEKWIFSGGIKTLVQNINPYLANASNVIIGRRPEPLTARPEAVMGSMARDGGFLILSREERHELLAAYPSASPLIRPLLGTQEFIDGLRRWCLWIPDELLPLAQTIPLVTERIEKVSAFRIASKAKTTNGYATIPHQFAQRAHKDGASLMIPSTTSERRIYIPIGYFLDNPIIPNSAQAVYGAEPWLFAIISSRLHMAWARAVGGGLETRIRYSSLIVYNNFPLPDLSQSKKVMLEQRAEHLLAAREKHPEKTIAGLYDPDTMPADLLAAHRALDEAVESCYRAKAFTGDEERLEYLFTLYGQVSAGESSDLFTLPTLTKAKAKTKTKRG
jgi:N-6 DNA Methylase